MRRIDAGLFALCLALPALAGAAPLKPEIAGLGFLIGTWTNGAGRVAETGGSSTGSSRITQDANGAVLLRRDHTVLFGPAGKPIGAFDSLMTIYADRGAVHADYFDGTHVIHYVSADIDPGRSVAFTSAAAPGMPVFRLIYSLAGDTLTVSFGMTPPGQTAFRPIASGTLHRSAIGTE